MKKIFPGLILSSILLASGQAMAAGGGVEIVNFYAILLHKLGVHDHHLIHDFYQPIMASLFGLLLIVIFGSIFRASIKRSGADIAPEAKVSVRSIFEAVMDLVWDLGQTLLGHEAKTFAPLLCGIFIFIFVCNFSGLVPGFPPATESFSTNLALGFTVFAVYNIWGLKANGLAYLKHFLGPVLWLAPLFVLIEIVSHAVRPFSLSMRLYGNIFGDHLVMSVLTGLVPIGLPLISFLFGSLVAILQSLVFTLLSSIYISMAITHEDH